MARRTYVLARTRVLAMSCIAGLLQLLELLRHVHLGPVLGRNGAPLCAVPAIDFVPLLGPEVVVPAPADRSPLDPLHRDGDPAHGALELLSRARPAAGLDSFVDGHGGDPAFKIDPTDTVLEG